MEQKLDHKATEKSNILSRNECETLVPHKIYRTPGAILISRIHLERPSVVHATATRGA